MPRDFLLPLIPLLLAGCSAVTTVTPLVPSTAPELQAGLRGTWRAEDEVFFIEFDSAGLGILAGLEWKDETRFEKNEMEFVAAQQNGWNFLSLRSRDEADRDEGYYLAAYRLAEANHLVVWNPKVEAFVPLVESGRLAGTVQRGQHSLSVQFQDGSQLFQTLGAQENLESLLDLSKPSVFTRVIPLPAGSESESPAGSPAPGNSEPR